MTAFLPAMRPLSSSTILPALRNFGAFDAFSAMATRARRLGKALGGNLANETDSRMQERSQKAAARKK